MSRSWARIRAGPRLIRATLAYDWRTEENFAQATSFLKDMVGEPTSTDPGNPDKPRFYYFETQQEDEALREFMRRLRRGQR